MTKVGYLIKCIKGLDIKNMYKTAKGISKKAKKNSLFILIDMLYCGLRFNAGYNDYREFEFYRISNAKRATYLTRGLNNKIIKQYNDKSMFDLFDDKARFNKEYKNYIGREWLDLRNATLDEFKAFTDKNRTMIVKPFDGMCGKGVEKVVIDDNTDIEKLYNTLKENNQLLVEEYIIQHNEMSRLNPSSVNSLRMFTFCKDGEAHTLQTILKIGNNGAVDNFYNGGMYTFADDDGVVRIPAIDLNDDVHEKHPSTGESIIGFKIPMIEEAKKLIESAALVHPEVGYIGWDVAISVKGPLIIEGNVYPGIFQRRASYSKNGEGILPLYRKYMDI